MKLLVLPGSIRKESYNLKLAAIAAEHARQAGVEVDLVTPADLAPIPLYNGDLEAAEGLPAAVKALKQRFIAAQAIVLARAVRWHAERRILLDGQRSVILS